MTTYYVRTDGNDSNDGLSDSSGGAWLTLAHAGAIVVAGDTVMVRASAGNASSYPTSSLDYTIASFFTPTAGSAGSGYVKWIGYNGMPTIGCPGLGFYNCAFQFWENLYLVATSASNPSFGLLNGGQGNCVVTDCIINMNNQAAMVGLKMSGGRVMGCEIYGGTTSPTSSSGANGLMDETAGCLFYGNRIRHCRDYGVLSSVGGTKVIGNLIYGCVNDGILSSYAIANSMLNDIIGNTINDNDGHGINLSGTNGAAVHCLRNNCVTNHVQSGKVGINVATSSSDQRKSAWGWNNVWNNTTNYSGVTADSTDLSVNPGYADAANGDFTPSEASLEVAFPTDF